jgi:Zn-dependent protease/CBS domain-containing protein
MTDTPRRRWSWEVGRLFGISIRIHATLFGLLLITAFAAPIAGDRVTQVFAQWLLVVCVFGCVLIHELAHALVARRFGCQTREILLLPIGGLAQVERMPERPGQEMLVALVGPAANIAIAAALGLVIGLAGLPIDAEQPLALGALIVPLFWINVSLAAFNLLPAFPMDGGRVLRAGLAMRLGQTRATRIAVIVGKVVAAVFIGVGLAFAGTMLAIIGVFVWFASAQESAVVALAASLAHATAADAMVRTPHVIDATVSVDAAAREMLAAGTNTFAVVEGGCMRGYVTAADLVKRIIEPLPHVAVGAAMHRDVPVIAPTERLSEVLAPLDRGGVVFVGDRDGIVGVLTSEQVATFAALREASAAS